MSASAPPRAPILRLVEANDLTPLWIRVAEDGRRELLLVETGACHGRAFLFPDRITGPAELVDLGGKPLRSLTPTPEADAWILNHGPGETLIVRF